MGMTSHVTRAVFAHSWYEKR